MNTLSDMANALGRAVLYLQGLQRRFELPVPDAGGYPVAYQAFLRTVVYLRILDISEDRLRELWHLEKKLLQLLHVDSTGSKTWFLDACGQSTHATRRLLLTNHDMGMPLSSLSLQLGLNFVDAPPELFSGVEMGEDAKRVLGDILELRSRIQKDIESELPVARAATKWAAVRFR